MGDRTPEDRADRIRQDGGGQEGTGEHGTGEDGTPAVPADPGELARRLDHLFRVVRPKDGAEYTYRDVAEGIAARGGPTISASYVWQLRTGVKDNPTKKHLEALAAFFGVAPAYFLQPEEAAAVEAELALLSALRDAGIRDIALRASGLSAPSLDVILSLIERTRTLEGLDGGRRRSGGAGGHAEGVDRLP